MDYFFLNHGLEGLNTALHNRAKCRDVDGVTQLLKIGADAHSVIGGVSVLERTLIGHDECNFSDWRSVESVVKILSDYGVTNSSVKYFITRVYCGNLMDKSRYIRKFLKR